MIYIICGPTGSGKTEAAKILSDYYDAPIVNADAFQIYRDMNIGTAKIDKKDLYFLRHHLLDIKNPDENFSVMEYQALFRQKIQDLQGNYSNIIVCGGTGLYIRASIYDYVFDEEKPADTSDLETLNNDELFSILETVDPQSAATLHKNNRKRVMRAIVISRNNNLSKSENINRQEHKIIYRESWGLSYLPVPSSLYLESHILSFCFSYNRYN